MAGAVKVLLECIGENVDRNGLVDTPMRVAKALQFFTKGYNESVKGLPFQMHDYHAYSKHLNLLLWCFCWR